MPSLEEIFNRNRSFFNILTDITFYLPEDRTYSAPATPELSMIGGWGELHSDYTATKNTFVVPGVVVDFASDMLRYEDRITGNEIGQFDSDLYSIHMSNSKCLISSDSTDLHDYEGNYCYNISSRVRYGGTGLEEGPVEVFGFVIVSVYYDTTNVIIEIESVPSDKENYYEIQFKTQSETEWSFSEWSLVPGTNVTHFIDADLFSNQDEPWDIRVRAKDTEDNTSNWKEITYEDKSQPMIVGVSGGENYIIVAVKKNRLLNQVRLVVRKTN